MSPDALINGELQRQAQMLAFNDAFRILSVLLVLVMVLVFLMQRTETRGAPPPTH